MSPKAKLAVIKRLLEMQEDRAVLLYAIDVLLQEDSPDTSFSINRKALELIDQARREIRHGNNPAD